MQEHRYKNLKAWHWYQDTMTLLFWHFPFRHFASNINQYDTSATLTLQRYLPFRHLSLRHLHFQEICPSATLVLPTFSLIAPALPQHMPFRHVSFKRLPFCETCSTATFPHATKIRVVFGHRLNTMACLTAILPLIIR